MFAWLKRSRETQLPAATLPSARTTGESAPDAARRGVELIQAGRYELACLALREAVRLDPHVASVHVNLAYALQECNDDETSIVHLEQALRLEPALFDARFMLAAAQERIGDLQAAADHYAAALAIDSGFEDAHVGLCRTLAQGQGATAVEAALQSATTRFPANPDLHLIRGNLALANGNPGAAVDAYRQALAGRPTDAHILANLGLALHADKRVAEAISTLQRAIEIAPEAGEAYVNLGLILTDEKRHAEAETVLLRARELQPENANTLSNHGNALFASGRAAEAEATFRRVVEIAPKMPGGYSNLGLCLSDLGRVEEAVAIYRRGLAIRPVPEMHGNLGVALQKLGIIDEAIEQHRAALALRPNNVTIRCNLAAALADSCQKAAANAAYREILEQFPGHLVAHNNLLCSLSVDERCSAAEYLDEAARFDAKVRQAADRFPLELPPQPRPKARLRVGFVSGDLCIHPVGLFIEGILHHLDRARFDLVAYPTAVKEDALTARIKPLFSQWRCLKGVPDEEAARRIRSDGVDILIDLAGHTGDNRLPIFAFRPSPVQLTWLGYYASTGMAAFDYILADEHCVPAGNEHAFSERVWRLPETRLCFTPPSDGSMTEVSELPAQRAGYVTFGCFQRLPKVTDAVLELWGAVFARLPLSRLLLQSHQTGRKVFVDQILARLGAVGITADRVRVLPPAPRALYLQSYSSVDMILDTFPYTGGTTTCEAMWMGVPTVTLAGTSMIGRQGVAMLSAAGLQNWISETPAQYIDKAVAFASDIPALVELRAGLRSQVAGSALFDVALFADRLGSALQSIWEERARAVVTT